VGGILAKVVPYLAAKLGDILETLCVAEMPVDLNTPSWNLHPLKGKIVGRWAVKVNGGA